MSCGVGSRRGSDPALLGHWRRLGLWRRPVATASIRPLAWEPPYATGVAQEIAKKDQKKKKKCKGEKRKKEKKKKRDRKRQKKEVPVMAQWLLNPTRNYEVVGSIPGLAPWIKDLALTLQWVRSLL